MLFDNFLQNSYCSVAYYFGDAFRVTTDGYRILSKTVF